MKIRILKSWKPTVRYIFWVRRTKIPPSSTFLIYIYIYIHIYKYRDRERDRERERERQRERER